MTEKKRTTVTTIETHEVWVITPSAERFNEVKVVRPEADHADSGVTAAEAPANPETGGNEVTTPGT